MSYLLSLLNLCAACCTTVTIAEDIHDRDTADTIITPETSMMRYLENFSYLFESHTRYPNPHCGVQGRPRLWPESKGQIHREQAIAGWVLLAAREDIITYRRAKNPNDYLLTPRDQMEAIEKYEERSAGYQALTRNIALARAVDLADRYSGNRQNNPAVREPVAEEVLDTIMETESVMQPTIPLSDDYISVETSMLDGSAPSTQGLAPTEEEGRVEDWTIEPQFFGEQEPPQGFGLHSEADVWGEARWAG